MPLCRLNVAVNRCDHILPQAAVNEIALFFKLCPILGLKICLILGKQLLITLIGFLRAGKSAGGILQDIGVSCPGQLFCLLLLLSQSTSISAFFWALTAPEDRLDSASCTIAVISGCCV